MDNLEAVQIVKKIKEECLKHSMCFDCPFYVDKPHLSTVCRLSSQIVGSCDVLLPGNYDLSDMMGEVN